MPVHLIYGDRQFFRLRLQDIHVRGHVDAPAPLRASTYRLNDGPPTSFYVEQVPDQGTDWRFQYKNSPARLRLPRIGDFTVEIPADAPELRPGSNQLTIEITDASGRTERAATELSWDPSPVSLPLDLRDLSAVREIQEIGQVVNGAFDVDPRVNVIRSRAPVAPDALLVLGSPHSSQEATYSVRFAEPTAAKYLGLSDFFVGHEAEDPPIGIKPGWSTAGLATVTYGWRPGSPPEVRPVEPSRLLQEIGPNPLGQARAWLACGDNSRRGERWVVKTDPAARFDLAEPWAYRVRHQVLFTGGANRTRFRIWPAGQPEPDGWLCDITDAEVDPRLPKFSRASFALFQHTGASTEWSDIRVRAF